MNAPDRAPVIAVIASADEIKESVAPALHNSQIIPVSKLISLYSLLADVPVDILFIDENFDGCLILEILPVLKNISRDLLVLLIADRQSEAARKSLLQGGFDVLSKPLEQAQVDRKVQNALEHARLLRKVRLMEHRKRSAEEPVGQAVSPAPDPPDMNNALRRFLETSANLEDLKKLSEQLTDSLTEYYLCAEAAIVLLDENNKRLQVRSCRGLDEEVLQTLEFSLHSGLYSWMRKTNRLLQISELPDQLEVEQLAVLEREAKLLHAEVVVPLLGRKQAVGFISLGSKFSGGPYSTEEKGNMFFFARYAGAAIENALLLQKTRGMALRDELTQLYNRHYWKKSLEVEVERSRRYNRPLSVAIFDIDHFKKVNDTFGHQKGDDVLRGLARYLLKSSRHTDVVGRYGGEEFIVILPETTAEFALLYCERLRQDVEMRLGRSGAEECIHPGLTISGGVTACDYSKDTAGHIIERADQALYNAKRDGRNRIQQQFS